MNVWITYQRVYLDGVRILVDHLEQNGTFPIHVLWDNGGVREGQDWPCKIAEMIKAADAWLLIMDDDFQDRRECMSEVGQIATLPDSRTQERIFPVAPSSFKADGILMKALFNRQRVTFDPSASEIGGEGQPAKPWERLATEVAGKCLEPVARDLGELKRDSFRGYWSEILTGRFTPFVGPLCYEVGENREASVPRIRVRVQNLIDALGVGSERDYVTSIVESRLPECLKAGDKDTPDWNPPELKEFQRACARLGAMACKVFGDTMSSKCQGMTNAREYCVGLEGGSEEVQRLREVMVETAALAGNVPKKKTCRNKPGGEYCLGAEAIHGKLRLLLSQVFGEASTSRGSVPDPVGPEGKAGYYSAAEDNDVGLRLSHIEWLGNLLWHTLRFDAPAFPTAAEMAFQFSVCGKTKCLSLVSLGTAASARDPKTLHSRCPLGMFGKAKKAPGKSGEGSHEASFSRSVARLICHAALKTGERKPEMQNASDPERVALSCFSSELKGERIAQPLLITINLDNEIERHLEGVRHSILYPAVYEAPREDEDARLGAQQVVGTPTWLLCVKSPQEKTPSYYCVSPRTRFAEIERRLAEVERRRNEDEGMRQDASGLALLGPLVVKLRGAPSHPIPNPLTFEELSGGAEARVSQNGTFHHRILLSSLDFARQVSLGESLPECIRDLLREEDRVVCFLGHALDDPDSLLGLQAHVWVSSSPDGWRPISPHEVSQQPTGKSTEEVPRTEGKECGVGVECTRADGFEQEFLSGLGIRSLPMRLSEVASEIQKVPGLANFECEVAKDGI